jgi:ligand-binding sensor domain-containing protein
MGRLVFVHRDRAGRLWLGSETGLFQSSDDGVSVRAATADGPVEQPVRAMFETAQGRLWFLVDRGLIRIEGQQVSTTLAPGAAAMDGPSAVLEDRDGNVWIATRQGLVRVRGDRWVTYRVTDGLPDDFVTALFEDREGSLWVGTRSGGIAQFTDRVVATRAGPPSLHDERWLATVAQDSTGAYWFGSRLGLLRWKDGQERQFTAKDGLPHTEVFAVAPGKAGEVWVGTQRGFARVRDGGSIDVPAPWSPWVSAIQVDGDQVWLGSGERLLRFRAGKLEQLGNSPHGPIPGIDGSV